MHTPADDANTDNAATRKGGHRSAAQQRKSHAQGMKAAPEDAPGEPPASIAAALRASIADGRVLLRTPGYAFNHKAGHRDQGEGGCVVGAAGASMARRFELSGKTVRAKDFAPEWERVFNTIEAIRTSNYWDAYAMMHGPEWDDESEDFYHFVADELGVEGMTTLSSGFESDNPFSEFDDHDSYRAYLDHLERVILPAIVHAEDDVRGPRLSRKRGGERRAR